MKKKKVNCEPINCYVYLATDGDMRTAYSKENKQLNYIKEYAKAHNIVIKKLLRRSVLGQYEANKQFNMMIGSIINKTVDGILVVNGCAVAADIIDMYTKVGMVEAAGGRFITVDAGELTLGKKAMGGLV